MVHQAYNTLRKNAISLTPVGLHLSDEDLAAELVGKTLVLIRAASRHSLILDRQLKAREDDSPAVRIGRLSDRRWISTLFPDALRNRCILVADDGTMQIGSDKIVRALLSAGCKPTTNRQIQKTLQPFRALQKIATAIKQEMVQEEFQRLAILRGAALISLSGRRQILTSETETYVRWKQLRIEQLRLRNISDQQQIQMNEGQIAAEQRRMEARISEMTDRIRMLEDLLPRLAENTQPEMNIILARALPPIHGGW